GTRSRGHAPVRIDAKCPLIRPDVPESDLAEDAERAVMKMATAGAQVVKGSDPGTNRVGHHATGREGNGEPSRAQEGPLALRVSEVPPVGVAQVVALRKDVQHRAR